MPAGASSVFPCVFERSSAIHSLTCWHFALCVCMCLNTFNAGSDKLLLKNTFIYFNEVAPMNTSLHALFHFPRPRMFMLLLWNCFSFFRLSAISSFYGCHTQPAAAIRGLKLLMLSVFVPVIMHTHRHSQFAYTPFAYSNVIWMRFCLFLHLVWQVSCSKEKMENLSTYGESTFENNTYCTHRNDARNSKQQMQSKAKMQMFQNQNIRCFSHWNSHWLLAIRRNSCKWHSNLRNMRFEITWSVHLFK